MYHYDQSRNSRVKCDASHSGLGAALEQEIEKDVWVLIAFASRIVVDNRIAIPMCLRKPLLSRLHRSHAGQLAMVDAA